MAVTSPIDGAMQASRLEASLSLLATGSGAARLTVESSAVDTFGSVSALVNPTALPGLPAPAPAPVWSGRDGLLDTL